MVLELFVVSMFDSDAPLFFERRVWRVVVVVVESTVELEPELDSHPVPLDPCVPVPSLLELSEVPDLWCLLLDFELLDFECFDLLERVLVVVSMELLSEPVPQLEPDEPWLPLPVVPLVLLPPHPPVLPVEEPVRDLEPEPMEPDVVSYRDVPDCEEVPYPELPDELEESWFIPEELPDRSFRSEPVPVLSLGYCPVRSVESCHIPLPCRPVVS